MRIRTYYEGSEYPSSPPSVQAFRSVYISSCYLRFEHVLRILICYCNHCLAQLYKERSKAKQGKAANQSTFCSDVLRSRYTLFTPKLLPLFIIICILCMLPFLRETSYYEYSCKFIAMVFAQVCYRLRFTRRFILPFCNKYSEYRAQYKWIICWLRKKQKNQYKTQHCYDFILFKMNFDQIKDWLPTY